MAFVPPEGRRGRERILLFGDSKAGKSLCWVDVMLECYLRGDYGHWHIIDTDDAVSDLFDELFPFLEDMATVYNCDTYEDIVEASQAIQKEEPNARNGDFVVMDMVDDWWDAVKDYYIKEVFGMTPEEYLLETSTLVYLAKQTAKGSDRDFGGFSTEHWMHMRKLYLAVEKPLTVNGKAHVFGVTGESQINPHAKGKKAVQELKDLGHIGFKNKGQNMLRHRFRTIIRVSRPGRTREITMAGDRYREHLWEAKHDGHTATIGDIITPEGGVMPARSGFSKQYMKRIAGWRVER